MATFYQTECEETFQYNQFSHLVEKECQTAVGRFKQILNSFVFFHFSWWILILLEIASTITLAYTMARSPIFAISLASFFLTSFSYVIIGYYLNGKKEEQFSLIKKEFFQGCRQKIPEGSSIEDFHLSLANSAFQLASYIGQKKVYAFNFPPFKFLETSPWGISYLMHQKNIQLMQEILMQRAIVEHIELIKIMPTDLSVHTSLANAYIALSKVYSKPADITLSSPLLRRVYDPPLLQEKFQYATKKAVEELKILDDLAPNDPWIHAQLALCYRHLEMFDEEIHEYEILHNLRLTDKDVLYRLGILYFQKGKNSKGLQIYEKLQKLDPLAAQQLIAHYT